MTLEETLAELLKQEVYHSEGYDDDAYFLAPRIERALQAAYHRGVTAANDQENILAMSDNDGVTAGIAAMTEGE